MSDSPYRISEDALRRSTGHAPGQPLIETEPELEIPHDLPIRVTPMSPASEIAALGQLSRARPSRRKAARVTALLLLAFPVGALLFNAVQTIFR